MTSDIKTPHTGTIRITFTVLPWVELHNRVTSVTIVVGLKVTDLAFV